VVGTDAAGFIGYAAGPTVHYVDRYGLGDALIARLPAETPWRIGHFVRRPPDGYLASLENGGNAIRDPGVAALYDRIRIITEGPLFTGERLRTIWRMNLGRYDRFVESYGLARLALAEVSTPRENGLDWNAPGVVVLTFQGAEISLPHARAVRALELSVSRNDVYEVKLRHEGRTVARRRSAPLMSADGSLALRSIAIAADRADAVLVRPAGGDGRFSLGHVRIDP
jgi:hypothetical protein